MILPIIGYGHPTLRLKAEPISPDYPDLKELIEDKLSKKEYPDGK